MNGSFSLSEVLRMLKRRTLVIASVTILGTLLALFFALNRPAVYEATAVIQIETPTITTSLASGGSVTTTSGNRIKLIEQKLMSRDSVEAVIEKFDLFSDSASMTGIEKVTQFRKSVAIAELIDPTQAWRPNVQPSGLSIRVQLSDPQKTADVANEFLSQVLVEGKKRSESRANQTLAFYQTEEARITKEIEALEVEFARFKERNAAALPSNITSLRDHLARLQESQLDVETQVIGLATNSARLRDEERQRQSDLLQQQLSLIQDRINGVEAALAAAPEVERVHNLMERQLDQLQEQYNTINTSLTEAAMNQELESQDQFERFEVLETAVVPEVPVSSGKAKLVLAGMVASLLLGIGIALALEVTSPVLRNNDKIEKELGIIPVVNIPVLKRPRNRLVQKMNRAATLILATMALPLMAKDMISDLMLRS